MEQNTVSFYLILEECRRIEELAGEIYSCFSKKTVDPELKSFWEKMAKEENFHQRFWKILLEKASEDSLPSVFSEPEKTAAEMKAILRRAEELRNHYLRSDSITDMFVLAYRLEFYMLNPTFEILFNLLSPLVGEDNSPGLMYEKHVRAFIAMFKKKGTLTPELELLGETLGGLWDINRQLVRQSTTDQLTSIMNRRGFLNITRQMLFLACRTRDTVGVVMVDIDHFKKVNDTFGHQAGDEVLKGVAGVLSKTLRRSDLLGRYGGEEFIIFLPGMKQDQIRIVAEKLRTAIEELEIPPVRVTASFGVVVHSCDRNDPSDLLDQLIKLADMRLYRAKQTGRNRVVDNDNNATSLTSE